MIIIDTPFHLTYSCEKKKPISACIGECKKSFWDFDLDNEPKGKCPVCGHNMQKAIEGVHYSVLKRKSGNAKGSELLNCGVIDNKDLETYDEYCEKKIRFTHISKVKPVFEKYASERWAKSKAE